MTPRPVRLVTNGQVWAVEVFQVQGWWRKQGAWVRVPIEGAETLTNHQVVAREAYRRVVAEEQARTGRWRTVDESFPTDLTPRRQV